MRRTRTSINQSQVRVESGHRKVLRALRKVEWYMDFFTYEGNENDLHHVFELFHKGNGYAALTGNDDSDDECTCKVKSITNEYTANQSCSSQTYQKLHSRR